MSVTVGALFAGCGGLELAVAEAIPCTRLLWVSEYEPATTRNLRPSQAAARVLSYRWPMVPNLGDIAEVIWPDVPGVDILTGGFPCTDVSVAGLRAGLGQGTRSGLWSRMADAIRALRPRLIVIENVRGLLSARADSDVEPCPWCLGETSDAQPALRALGAVLGDLADLGYDAVWHGLSASDVGAPHRRFRVFLLAWPQSGDPDSLDRDGWFAAGLEGEAGSPARSSADAERDPRPPHDPYRPTAARRGYPVPDVADNRGRGSAQPGGYDQSAADSNSAGIGRDGRAVSREAGEGGRSGVDIHPAWDADYLTWGDYAPAIARWERALGRPAPAPTEISPRGNPRLSARFVEWMMGLPDGWVCDVPGLSQSDQLRILGNGVVPQQGAAAIRTLLPYVPGWRWAA